MKLSKFYRNANYSVITKLSEAQNKTELAQVKLIKTKYKEAINYFEQANEIYYSLGNEWEAALVEYQIAYCLAQDKNKKLSNEKLKNLSEKSEKNGYKWITALADGWLGNNYYSLGEISNSIYFDEKSLQLAEEIQDIYKLQRGHLGLANQYSKLHNRTKSLNHIFATLDYPIKYHIPKRQIWRNLIFTSEVLYSFGLYEASSVYADEEIIFNQTQLNDNWMTHSSLLNAAKTHLQLENFDEALRLAKKSELLTKEFPDNNKKIELRGISLVAIANSEKGLKNYRRAIKNYDLAVGFFEDLDLPIRAYEARKGRLLCYIELKENGLIDKEFPIIFDLFDKNRQLIQNDIDKNKNFDHKQDIYDIATNYAYFQRNDKELAFNYSENSRARSLLDKINKQTNKTYSLNDLLKSNPKQVQTIYYSVLKDKLLIWFISDNKYYSAESKITQKELENLNYDFSKSVINNEKLEKINSLSKKLYSKIIEPIEDKLDSSKSICFIPDKSLFRVPFAALVSPKTQKYLIEDYSVFISPSASVFIAQNELAKQKATGKKEKLLAIGNPKFSTKEFPELPDLPSAKSEAISIAKIYDTKDVYVGLNATKGNVIEEFGDADVIHFAGHYLPNAKSTNKSKFIFASQTANESESNLTIEELNQSKSMSAKLIVLAACNSGSENYYKGEGMIGASRVFMSLNVPVVVASQWQIDSFSTSVLMQAFHRNRKAKNMRTIEALRQAQVAFIKSERLNFKSPFYWAGFVTFGSYSSY